MATPEPAACAVAHGDASDSATRQRTLVAVFASPVAEYLLRYGPDLGYRTVLLEPDSARIVELSGITVVNSINQAKPDGDTDVVVTDHHRDELGVLLRDALSSPVRWIGLMGNRHHAGPHHAALAALGVPEQEVARVHRPVGLNIGSRTPPEIAIATLAGLLAERNGRPGGFTF